MVVYLEIQGKTWYDYHHDYVAYVKLLFIHIIIIIIIDAETIQSSSRWLQEANRTVAKSQEFKGVLRLVLDVGNVLNSSSSPSPSPSPSCFGFELSSTLCRLSETRSLLDRQCTLLHVLAQAVLDDYPHLSLFSTHFDVGLRQVGQRKFCHRRNRADRQMQRAHLLYIHISYCHVAPHEGSFSHHNHVQLTRCRLMPR